MNRFVTRRLVTALCATGMLGLSTGAMASAFQLWEQSGASVGNYHAGYAASAEDASTAWFNPAGITKFKHQQIVVGAAAIMSSFKYRGDVSFSSTTPFPPVNFSGVTAQGGAFGIVPDFHYVTPITEKLGFGFGIVAPFGLKTDYGSSTPMRYAATRTSITVVDISPSLAYEINKQFSLGLGFDVQRAMGEFDNVSGSRLPISPTFPYTAALDTTATNKANGTGYGYHAGIMYDLSPDTRFGLSYHSQVVHHLTGTSKFVGPIAQTLNAGTNPGYGVIASNRAKVNITLPPYTALSAFHHLAPKWNLMGSVIFTQWNTFKALNFQGLAGAVPAPAPFFVRGSSGFNATIPENYRNTWNVSVGADYAATETFTLRSGIGFDQTPVSNAERNVQLPDNNRYVIALGGHYKATKTVAVDLGWTHLFMPQSRVSPGPLTTGAKTVTTSGNVNGGADVFGGQITWDIC
ncbi:MAG: OmpP1/FadL family transporter [Gammaproteobacteria bacterium]